MVVIHDVGLFSGYDATLHEGNAKMEPFDAAMVGRMAEGTAALILSAESAAHFYPATPEQVVNACYAAGFRVVTRGVIGDELVAAEYLRLWEEEPWGTMIRSSIRFTS